MRRYLRLPFTLGFWALTFTAAAGATYAVRLLVATPGMGHVAGAWLAVARATGIIGAIGVRSLTLPWTGRAAATRARG